MGESTDAVSELSKDKALLRFREAFQQDRGRLIGMAVLLGAAPWTAEDLVDDAFAATFAPWRAGRIDDLGAYLRRAVINGLHSQGRRERARSRWLDRQRAVSAVAPADDRLADHHRLTDALRQLPADLRTTLVLRFCEDLSEHETAAVLDVAVGTVKSRTSRGLDRLRTILKETDCV